MMGWVNFVIDWLNVRAAYTDSPKERKKLLLITLGIGLVVVVFDPF